jgi:hypothetical protein
MLRVLSGGFSVMLKNAIVPVQRPFLAGFCRTKLEDAERAAHLLLIAALVAE